MNTRLHAVDAMRVTEDVAHGSNEHWVVEGFTVDNAGHQIAQLEALCDSGRSCPPGRYTRLLRRCEGRARRELIMSDTPDELRDIIGVFRMVQQLKARRIVVNGLGLGCVLKGFLALDHVEHVDVVEISQELVDLMTELAPWVIDPRVHVHVADAYEMRWPVGTRWDVAWHDVWDELCEDNLSQIGRLNRMYGGRVDFQEAWGHEFLKYQRQRGRSAWGW
ncbi:hypothetical protein LCGC14_2857220 [marine sediment metagenome]|uniref:PABS domain-containing protein n=1 Tax=marine sediment metagenome TaxID=412755 RepID=A0A0F9AXN4_9ZZZZ